MAEAAAIATIFEAVIKTGVRVGKHAILALENALNGALSVRSVDKLFLVAAPAAAGTTTAEAQTTTSCRHLEAISTLHSHPKPTPQGQLKHRLRITFILDLRISRLR